MTIIVNSPSIMMFIFAPLVGMLFLGFAVVMMITTDKIEDLLGIGFSVYIGGLLIFETLFSKEQILVDHVRRIFVHKKRSLLSDSIDIVIGLDEIEAVVRMLSDRGSPG